jgi:tight adherence protein B
VTGLVLAVIAAFGTYLAYTSVVFGWSTVGPARSRRLRTPATTRPDEWLRQAGLTGVHAGEFAAVMAALFLVGALIGYALFGGPLPALIAGTFAAAGPVASYRARRERRLADARNAWPRMIEELRLLTGSVGRSIPQALFEVGRRGPAEMRPAFAEAEREWLLTTDFRSTLTVLQRLLADPTADSTCETLLVAHEVGGADLDKRLAALAEDRALDLQGRKDARAKQAGVRFARRFVLVVPIGMAVAGLSIGSGRAAYQTPLGQLAAVVGLAAVVCCWLWAGRLLRLPGEDRVFIPSSARPSESGR